MIIRYRVLMVGLVLALVCGACGAREGTDPASTPEEAPVAKSGDSPSRAPDADCGQPEVTEPEHCYTVNVGGTQYRYGYAPAGFNTSNDVTPRKQAVLVDPGYTGIPSLTTGGLSDIASRYLLGGLSDFDLVVIEELWVTREVSDECADAMTDFYHSFRLGPAATQTSDANEETASTRNRVTSTMSLSCGIKSSDWSINENHYEDILPEIESRHNIDIVGFVGASLGSIRWTYVDPQRYDFALLVRPYPAYSESDMILGYRGETIDNASIATLDIPLPGAAPAGRKLPVDSSDVVAARIASAAHGVTPSTAEEIGRWSDNLWQRFGVDSISTALLSYWQTICPLLGPAFTGYTDDWAGDPSDVYTYLRSFHQVCDRYPGLDALIESPHLQNVCVVISHSDTVSPSWFAYRDFRYSGAEMVLSTELSHHSLDGLSECVDKVSLSPASGSDATTNPDVEQVNDPTSNVEYGQRPSTMIEGLEQEWRLTDESACRWGSGYGHVWNLDILMGEGTLDTAPILAVTDAQAISLPAIAIYQTYDDGVIDKTLLSEEPAQVGWLTWAQGANFKLLPSSDGGVVVVEGTPAAAVQAWTTAADSDLQKLEPACWSQWWEHRTANAAVRVYYGDEALLQVLRDRLNGAELVADDQHPNIFTYENQLEQITIIDLRPQTVIAVVGISELGQPLPTADELAEMLSG